MKELGKILAHVGIGGFYRRVFSAEGVEMKGPYPTEGQANPFGSARLPFPAGISSEFHFKKPKGAVAPDPVELRKIE